jgi:lipopolysaccharide/colanic/teichoic acid biosynthesis glycosyltransferase
MVALLLTGEHEIFYRQQRIGKNGKEFGVLKFATMLKDSPNMPGGFITQQRDPRVLPFGSFLRKSKINELPQLINILIGQMSFVGPRPIVKSHLDVLSQETRTIILKMTPGLTGIGSLVFRDEEGILDKAGGDRAEFHDAVISKYKGDLELWYSRNENIRTYFLLILLTAIAVLRISGNLYKRIFPDLPSPPSALVPYL